MKLTPEQINHIYEVYEQTKSASETAKICGIKYNNVYYYVCGYKEKWNDNAFHRIKLNDYGIDGRRKLSKYDIYIIRDMYFVQKLSVAEIAKMFNVTRSAIYYYVKDDEYRNKIRQWARISSAKRYYSDRQKCLESSKRSYLKKRALYKKLMEENKNAEPLS